MAALLGSNLTSEVLTLHLLRALLFLSISFVTRVFIPHLAMYFIFIEIALLLFGAGWTPIAPLSSWFQRCHSHGMVTIFDSLLPLIIFKVVYKLVNLMFYLLWFFCSCSVGIALPVYSTFKAIESKDQDAQNRCLLYWAGTDFTTLFSIDLFVPSPNWGDWEVDARFDCWCDWLFNMVMLFASIYVF